MWARTALLAGLVGLVSNEGALAQGPVVSYPREYRTSLVKYAVVDRVDGLSRDLKLELPGDCLLCHQAAVVSDTAFP